MLPYYHIVSLYKRGIVKLRERQQVKHMSYKEKIIKLLDRIDESRFKEIYNFLVYCYLKGKI